MSPAGAPRAPRRGPAGPILTGPRLAALSAVQLAVLVAVHDLTAAALLALVHALCAYTWLLAGAGLSGRLHGIRTPAEKVKRLSLLTALLFGGYAVATTIWLRAVFGAGITSPWVGTTALLLTLPLLALAWMTGVAATRLAVHPEAVAAKLH